MMQGKQWSLWHKNNRLIKKYIIKIGDGYDKITATDKFFI